MLLIIAAPVRLIYIPSTLFVSGNAAATASNIAAHQSLFRLGIASDLFCGTILIFLVLALYRLFKAVDKNLAVLIVILGGVMPAAIDFLLFLRLHGQEILAAEILWGLWLFPLAILVLRSGFLPRFLGV